MEGKEWGKESNGGRGGKGMGEGDGKEGKGCEMRVGKDGWRRKVRSEKGKDRKEWRRVERYG